MVGLLEDADDEEDGEVEEDERWDKRGTGFLGPASSIIDPRYVPSSVTRSLFMPERRIATVAAGVTAKGNEDGGVCVGEP